MRPAHYMRFIKSGLPTHLPPEISIYPETGNERAFLAQFYCFPGRLEVKDAMCLHLYQDPDEDEPCPVVVVVPNDSPENCGKGIVNRRIDSFDIEWEYRVDPEVATIDDVELAESKAGGTCYFDDMVDEGELLLLQLRQHPAGFNFGGYSAVIIQTKNGDLEVRLG